jgi:hypothetical protein
MNKLPSSLPSRKACVSKSLQPGVDPSKLALSTGHQDPRSVLKYLINSNASLASGSLQQAKWLRHDDEEQFAGVNLGTQLIEKSLFSDDDCTRWVVLEQFVRQQNGYPSCQHKFSAAEGTTIEKKEYHVTMNLY